MGDFMKFFSLSLILLLISSSVFAFKGTYTCKTVNVYPKTANVEIKKFHGKYLAINIETENKKVSGFPNVVVENGDSNFYITYGVIKVFVMKFLENGEIILQFYNTINSSISDHYTCIKN